MVVIRGLFEFRLLGFCSRWRWMILFEEFWVLLNFNFGLSFGIESEVMVVGDALFFG